MLNFVAAIAPISAGTHLMVINGLISLEYSAVHYETKEADKIIRFGDMWFKVEGFNDPVAGAIELSVDGVTNIVNHLRRFHEAKLIKARPDLETKWVAGIPLLSSDFTQPIID